MNLYAGIDIGSTSIKLALVGDRGELLEQHCQPSGGSYHQNALDAYQALLDKAGLEQEQVDYVVSTGYGRKLFSLAQENISEIIANAYGAAQVAPGIRTIINIGGQDIKIIALDAQGICKNFAMNDKCAAGTGRFLDMVAVNLQTPLEDFGQLHQSCDRAPVEINSTCTVFADSEIISLLAGGASRAEIIAGVHYSIARRVARMAKRVGIEGEILFDGGPALNQGLVEALETELMKQVKIPEFPRITTAIGAALVARQACRGEVQRA